MSLLRNGTELPDRRVLIIVFAVLLTLLAIVSGVTALRAAASDSVAEREGIARTASSTSAIFTFGLGAFVFASLAAGSFRGRRWAQPLTVAVAGVWLVIGVVGSIAVALIVPKIVADAGPEFRYAGLRATALMVAIHIVLPLILIVGFSSAAIRATFERRDPHPRWTDRTPVAVLALAVLMAFACVSLFATLSEPAVPVFGSVLTGGAGVIAVLALAILFATIALGLYRLRESAWWSALLLHIIGGAVAALTIARGDLARIYARAGSELPSARAVEVFRDPALWAVMVLAWGAALAFLIYLRRYFRGTLVPRTRSSDPRVVVT